jgi:GntR family transcriptional repressor for pyruvate dehydrogenase complex
MPHGPRLYQDLVRSLASDIAEGKYPIGSRLPPERHLVQMHSVSTATLRRALITLEAQGVIEIRYGAGAYVARRPGAKKAPPNCDLTAFEISEAGLICEAEEAGLASPHRLAFGPAVERQADRHQEVQ